MDFVIQPNSSPASETEGLGLKKCNAKLKTRGWIQRLKINEINMIIVNIFETYFEALGYDRVKQY